MQQPISQLPATFKLHGLILKAATCFACITRLSCVLTAVGYTSITLAADKNPTIAEVVVIGESKIANHRFTVTENHLHKTATEDILQLVPGAYASRNGSLTALPQYRGSNSEQISMIIDGMPTIAGGPNAMDAPLSSVPGTLVQTVSVSKGIASVSSAQESLGGVIKIMSQHGLFAPSEAWQSHLQVNSQYTGNNDATHSSLQGLVSNQHHKAGINYSYQTGDNQAFSDGEIPNTFFQRSRASAFYGWQTEHTTWDIAYAHTDTNDTGTAALPMDIIYIDTDALNTNLVTDIGQWRLHMALGSQHIAHGMDNFSHRTQVQSNAQRYTDATGKNYRGHLYAERTLPLGDLTLGIDASSTLHNADITNPANSLFYVSNFNDVDKRLQGGYVEWVVNNDQWSWETGLRHNRWQTDAGDVTGPMMLSPLVPLFNNSDRKRDEHYTDAVIKVAYHAPTVTWSTGLAQKHRSPSYQQLYLWAPLQSTGGLADGRNYIGNIQLNEETSREWNIGVDIENQALSLSLQGFYRRVDDYIQGTPTQTSNTPASVNMISMMMSGQTALQFNNVDAVLYGFDAGYKGTLNDHIYYSGNLSYVRGKREDISDNLYRIAPLRHLLTIGTQWRQWTFSLTSEIASKQTKVSAYNNEQPSSGYGLLHINASWQAMEQLQLTIGIDNLFDKHYQAHLNGYNRVNSTDVPLGNKLPGMGRNIQIGFRYMLSQ